MNLQDVTLPDCLESCSDGSLRVTGHRVSLYLVLEAHFAGAPLEEIETRYPTIPRSKLLKVLAYCTQNEAMMRSYFAEETQTRARVRAAHVHQGPTLAELRERMARQRNGSDAANQ